MEYEDFRIEVTPNTDPNAANQWRVRLIDCPNPVFAGKEDSNQAVLFDAETLRKLRSPHNHPTAKLVQSSGARVWQTLMGPNLSAAFLTIRQTYRDQSKGLRLVTVLRGTEGAGPGLNPIDLPIEAMHQQDLAFVAQDHSTPLVRSFGFRGTYVPAPVVGLLRILLVTACPKPLPKANIAQEVEAIKERLKPLEETGRVHLVTCLDATVLKLREALVAEQFDIVHFICHGARGTGADSYVCLVDPTDGSPAAVGAGTLTALLKNSPLRLVVFSACSSAALPADAPVADPYPVSAFAGVAQSLINTHEQLGAVVAMQFDFETNAAVAFSK